MKLLFPAAVLFKQKKPLKLLNLSFSENLKKGQVLVEIIKTGICGAQVGEIAGVKGQDKWLPHCLGHEGYGKVVSKDSNVRKVKIGDEVIMHWKKGSGKNSNFPNYFHNEKKINAGAITTFQKYAVVSENRVTKVKLNEDLKKIAPLFGCVISTAYGIIKNDISFDKKNKFLIFGAGGVGVCLAILLYSLGVNKKNIFLIDKNSKKKKLLSTINFKKNLIDLKKIKNQTFDRVFDTTGNTNLLSLGFDSLNKNGELVIIGQPKIGSVLKLKDPLKFIKGNKNNDGVKIIATDGGEFNPDNDMGKLIAICKKNISLFKKIVTHEIELKNINKGIEKMKNGDSFRIIIDLQK